VPPPSVSVSSPAIQIATIDQARRILRKIEQVAAEKPALIYVGFNPPGIREREITTEATEESFRRIEACNTAEYEWALGLSENKAEPTLCPSPESSDELELLLVSSEGKPTLVRIPVTRKEVEQEAQELYNEVSFPGGFPEESSTQMYEWLIAPIEDELQEREIKNLLFIMPPKLRLVPLAALYDAETEQYLVQKEYNLGFAPSLNLLNTDYRNIQNESVLAFGASIFEQEQKQKPLPAVEIEVPLIKEIRGGKSFLNEGFTLKNFQANRPANPFPIIHLSTHGNFEQENLENVYIQLYDRKLNLNQLRDLATEYLQDPVVELLVISACKSAVGDEIQELGFSGLAVKLDIKTVIGSLWEVGDLSTSALMAEFYHQLKNVSTKAEALRRAQVAMIKGQIKLEGDEIVTSWDKFSLPDPLSEELAEEVKAQPDWSNPYYWSPFTIIGSPW
jgi:CHAT domain-containing protein